MTRQEDIIERLTRIEDKVDAHFQDHARIRKNQQMLWGAVLACMATILGGWVVRATATPRANIQQHPAQP